MELHKTYLQAVYAFGMSGTTLQVSARYAVNQTFMPLAVCIFDNDSGSLVEHANTINVPYPALYKLAHGLNLPETIYSFERLQHGYAQIDTSELPLADLQTAISENRAFIKCYAKSALQSYDLGYGASDDTVEHMQSYGQEIKKARVYPNDYHTPVDVVMAGGSSIILENKGDKQ